MLLGLMSNLAGTVSWQHAYWQQRGQLQLLRCSYPGGFAGRGLIWLISGGDMPVHPEGPKGQRAAGGSASAVTADSLVAEHNPCQQYPTVPYCAAKCCYVGVCCSWFGSMPMLERSAQPQSQDAKFMTLGPAVFMLMLANLGAFPSWHAVVCASFLHDFLQLCTGGYSVVILGHQVMWLCHGFLRYCNELGHSTVKQLNGRPGEHRPPSKLG
jgi:hypothetical protein